MKAPSPALRLLSSTRLSGSSSYIEITPFAATSCGGGGFFVCLEGGEGGGVQWGAEMLCCGGGFSSRVLAW